MVKVALLMVLKVITLIAATAQTVGFVGLFAFDALQPYKWRLLVGGTIAIVISEGLAYLLGKHLAGSGDAPRDG
jgi:ethanolamine ammonia-lyase large subunit